MPNIVDNSEIRELNQAFLEKITSRDEGMQKEAADAVTEFTRMRMREDSFFRKIMPPVTVGNEDLDRRVESALPVIIVDREPESPMAYSLPFATLPLTEYIVGDRYPVPFARIATRRFATDVSELRTFHMDIRQVLSSNALKDVLYHEDSRWIATCNAVMGGAADTDIPAADGALWRRIAGDAFGGVTRESVNDALMILNQTPAALNTATVLANQVTAKQIQKWHHDEVGGTLSQEIFQNGLAERTIFGVKWLFTIKRNLVPDNTIFMFAEPKYLGKSFVLEDITMHLDREAYMLQFFAYEEIGGAIGNPLAVARADFYVPDEESSS
jgi:hypothetical protein